VTLVLRDVAIIGGGCYGTFYAGQLAEARDRGRLEYRRVLVVDHDPACRAAHELAPRPDRALVVADWDDFLDRFLGAADAPRPAGPDDALVPTPLMPHLMARWLERRARADWPGREVGLRPLVAEAGTPYESTGPDGTRYLSFADWICPVHCIEPLTCPVIRAPRTWDLSGTVESLARRLGLAGPATFVCRHQAFGVGMFFAREARAGAGLVAGAGASGEAAAVVVATVSRCHGAACLLELGHTGTTGVGA